MTARHTPTERLLELQQILAQNKATVTLAGDRRVDPVAVLLADVPTERIRRFNQALRAEGGTDSNDEIDMLTMRLLLNDFTRAVEHLRTVADIAASLIDNAANPVHEAARFVKKEIWRDEKRRSEPLPARGPTTATE